MSKKDFYICYDEYVDSYRGSGKWASWYANHDVLPKNVIYGTYKTANNLRSTNGMEVIYLLDQKEPDFSEPFYLVYGVYSSGDSFGSATGKVEWVGLIQDKKLLSMVLSRLKIHSTSLNTIKYNGDTIEIYVPWCGYFETLESLEWDWVDVVKM